MILDGYQIDRVYSLIVGTEEDAVEINNLEIKFDVIKTSNNTNKRNSAKVEIYNLSESRRKKLEEDFVQVSLSVGYAHTEIRTLFVGEVINVVTSKIKPFLSKKSGADIITTLEISEIYKAIHGTHVSKLVPANKTVGDAIKEIAKTMPKDVVSVQMNGEGIKTPLPDGYPLSGNPVHLLDEIATDYHLDWQLDNKVLLVSDIDGSFENVDKKTVPSISQMSGLIESPQYINEDAKRLRRKVKNKTPKHNTKKLNSMKLKIMLNPSIVAGSIIYLDFGDQTGYYKVGEVKHRGDYRGNDWFSELVITETA